MKIKYILPLCLFLLLTACGGKEGASGDRTVYVPEEVAYTTGLKSVSEACVVDGTVYLLGKTDSGGFLLQSLPLEGGEAVTLPDYRSGFSGDSFVSSAAIQAGTDGTLWVMEYGTVQSAREDGMGFQQDEMHVLRNLDTEGKELARFEYAALEEALGPVYSLLADGEGTVFATGEKWIAALDESGAADFTLTSNAGLSISIALGDGRIGLFERTYGQDGDASCTLRTIDKEARDWGETFTLPPTAIPYRGMGDALFYYECANTLCRWQKDAAEGEQVMNLIDLGMETGSPRVFQGKDEGLVLLVTRYGESGTGVFPYILTPAEAGGPEGKKVLTLASLQLAGSLREAVMEFNRTNPDYRISVTDYSQYGDRQTALTRLATEIGAGKIPDILDLYAAPTGRWAANGMLEDLWPYIDADPELGRGALMERVFQAAEMNGKLYEIGPYFAMQTLTGAKSAVGDRMTWTAADMRQALEAMPEDCLPTGYDRAGMLEHLTELNWSRFVDWEKGTCSFTGEEFKALLRSCKDFPGEPVSGGEEAACLNKEIMLYSMWADGFTFPQRAKYILGDDISYVGYPNEWGEVGSSFAFSSSVAMSSDCREKEGAWAFLRTLLLPQGETADSFGYFPVNRSAFEQQMERLATPVYPVDGDGNYLYDERGERIETPVGQDSYAGGVDLTYYAVTQEECDQLMALYNAIDSYVRRDPSLTAIITETAGAYFAGDKSLDETADLIQNRASLYVNEQT